MINSDNSGRDAAQLVTQKVLDTIDRNGLLDGGKSVLAALSGGADSVCMLSVLSGIGKKRGFKLYAAHLNHMIRGEEADEDESFARELCEKMGIEFFSESADVPALAKLIGRSEEEAGRRARYEFLRRVCCENDIDLIATAHNRNDQAETVLMRIIRGTGLSGLRGIRYKRGDGVIRPLLDVTRGEIEGYCAAKGLEYRTDSTNLDTRYTRNNIRLSLIPTLEKEFNPNIVNALANLADVTREDADFLDGYASRLYARLGTPMPKMPYKALHIETLKTIKQRSIVSRLISICAKDAMGKDYALEKKHIDAALKIIDGNSSGVKLPGGLDVSVRYGWLEFKKTDIEQKTTQSLNYSNNNEFYIEVGLDKLYNIENIGAQISLTLINREALGEAKHDILLDADKLGLDDNSLKSAKFVLRSRIIGDRIAVYKNGKTKKLKSLFIDRKIRSEDRDRVPVLCLNGEIIAIPGVRISEIYKADRRTKNYLVVHYERYEN